MNKLFNILHTIFDLPFLIFVVSIFLYYGFIKNKLYRLENDWDVVKLKELLVTIVDRYEHLKYHIDLMVWFILYFFIFIF